MVRYERLRCVDHQLEVHARKHILDERLSELTLHEVVSDNEADTSARLSELQAALDERRGERVLAIGRNIASGLRLADSHHLAVVLLPCRISLGDVRRVTDH